MIFGGAAIPANRRPTHKHVAIFDWSIREFKIKSDFFAMSTVSKRKSDSPAEPSPKPKRKQRAVSSSPKKRTRDTEDIDAEIAPKVKLTKKNKSTNELSENAQTPKRGRPRKVVEVPEIQNSPGTPILVRQPITAQKGSKSTIKSENATTPASKTPSRNTRTPKIKVEKDVIRSAVKKAHASEFIQVPKPLSEGFHQPNVNPTVLAETTEEPPVHMLDQMWNSTALVIGIIGPLLTGLVLLCHVASLVPPMLNPAAKPDQGIASMGMAFFLVLVVIALLFLATVFPLILVSRLFTDIVTSSLDQKARWAFKRDLNSYTTFVALFIMFAMTATVAFHTTFSILK